MFKDNSSIIHVAICLSGAAPFINTKYALQLRNHLMVNRSGFTTNLFASLHHEYHEKNANAETIINALRSLEPNASEIYSSGPYICNKKKKCDKWSDNRACEFLLQFEGIRRSYRLMEMFEQQHGITHKFVVRHRFDILTHFHYALHTNLGHNENVVGFMGVRRPIDQQVSRFDFDDKGWICTRAAASVVMSTVNVAYTECGELLQPKKLIPLCNTFASGHWHTMYFECIIIVNLLKKIPNAVIWDNRNSSYNVGIRLNVRKGHCKPPDSETQSGCF